MDKFEIVIEDVGYSVYCNFECDYNDVSEKTSCDHCGEENVIVPSVKVEIGEIFDAEKMIRIELSAGFVSAAKKEVAQIVKSWHTLCDGCANLKNAREV